jgi:hypothetical protein
MRSLILKMQISVDGLVNGPRPVRACVAEFL